MDCYYFMYEANVLFLFLMGFYVCIWVVKIFTIIIKDLSDLHDCLANCSNMGKTLCLCEWENKLYLSFVLHVFVCDYCEYLFL